ncbi:hypothetical protein B0A48_10460 [Cryoendolithus antarcticus]|uniref:Uncharacterized protein n=1 Tax=Cryoendolithus antarcticus TaxID=1507870 RepID=A0A1V8SXL9_9PEZI|nr:hypothetical protein B0A48_10460 [Cryoendolithus antarcticus]
MASFFPALFWCVVMGFISNSYRASRLSKEPFSERRVDLVLMTLIPTLWFSIQYRSCRDSGGTLDISPNSVIGFAVCCGLWLWGFAGEDEVYQHPPRMVEPLPPRSVSKEVPGTTEVKETRESEGAAAPAEVKRTQKRQEKPWVKPGCSSVPGYGTWKRTELTPGHAPTPKPSVVRRQTTIVPRHKYSSYSHLLAQPSLASSSYVAVRQETPTAAVRPRPQLTPAQIRANVAARKATGQAKVDDPYTPQHRAMLFPASSSADILSALQPSDRAHVVTEWLRLSAVVMETMDQSPLFNTGFANSAASEALRTDRVLRKDLGVISNRFTSLLGWVTHRTSLFWDLSRLDQQWIKQWLDDIVVMATFLRNLGERHGGVRGCEWTWSVHEAVRRFGVAMVDMMKIDVQSLSKKDLEELDSALMQEQARTGQVNGPQCAQSNYKASTMELTAPSYTPANGAPFTGGAGMKPQTSGGGVSEGAGSVMSNGNAAATNSSNPAISEQQQPTSQDTGSPALFPAPTSQQPGTGNPPPPALFSTTSSSQQAGTQAPSSSAQPGPATTLTQPAQTQAQTQSQSTNGWGLAASKYAPQNSGFATSQPVGPSGSSTANTTLTNTSASQAGISGASQVAGAPGADLGGQTGPASASSVNGTPGPGVSTFGAQSAGLVAAGQNTAQQAGQAGWLPVPTFSGLGGLGNQTTAAPTTSASGFGTTAANAPGGAPTPSHTPAPSSSNSSGFSANKSAKPTSATLDTSRKGIRPVLNHEAGKKLRAFEDNTARQYVSEYFKTARREIEQLRTYMASSAKLKSTLSDTNEISDTVSNLTLLWTQIDEWGSENTFERDSRFTDIWVELHGIPAMLDDCIKLARRIMKAAKELKLVTQQKSARKLRDKAKELRGGETRMLMKWPLTNPAASDAQGSSTFVQPATYTNDSFPYPGASDNAQVSAPVPDSSMQSSGSGLSSSLPTSASSPPASIESQLPPLGPRPDLNANTGAALHQLPIPIAQRHFDSFFCEVKAEINETRREMVDSPEDFKDRLISSNEIGSRLLRAEKVFLELWKWANMGDPGDIGDPKYKGDDYHRKTRLEDWWTEARQISAPLELCLALGNDIIHTGNVLGWGESRLKAVAYWLKQLRKLRIKIPMLPYRILLTMPIAGEFDGVELKCS